MLLADALLFSEQLHLQPIADAFQLVNTDSARNILNPGQYYPILHLTEFRIGVSRLKRLQYKHCWILYKAS